MHKCFRFLIIVLLINLTFSCAKKKNTPEPDCGCDGTTFASVENVKASYLGNGYFVMNQKDQYGNLTYGWACKTDTTWQKSALPDSFNYTVSGNLKRVCPQPNDAYALRAPGGPFEITAIRKD